MRRTNQFLRLLLAAAGASLIGCAEDDTEPRMIGGPSGLDNISVPEFDILSTAEDDQGFSAATDGNSYLVGFSTGNLGTGNAFGIVKSFVVSATGSVGQLESTGRIGDTPMVAFDGTNYLLAWVDRNSGSTGPVNVFGQFIDPMGAEVGHMFRISTEGQVVALSGVTFGGGQYLVTYLRFNTTPNAAGLYGKFVSPAGALGPRMHITNPGATGALNDVATDGTDFLVAWNSGTSFEAIKVRVVQANGTLGPVATLNSSPEPSPQSIGVAFNRGNYFVTWSDSVGLHESDVYGRLVSQAGLGKTGRISIAAGPGQQIGRMATPIGNNFLVTWIDLQSDPANTTVKGRFFTSDARPIGTVHTLFTTDPATGKLPITPGPFARGTDAFYLIGRALPGPDPQSFTALTGWDLHGAVRTLTP